MSRQPWSSRISRPAREALFWGGAAGVVYWLAPSVVLQPIDARTIVVAPAVIGLCFGTMVLASVNGSGSYSLIVGRPMWQRLATGSYTLYLTHMMVLSLAARLAARAVPLAEGASLTARWIAFLPWYLALTMLSAYLLHRYVERPVLQWRDRRLQTRPRESKLFSTAFFHPA
jgi:peptidoglycan/LPS O-acetylase OafA/YrhL